MISVCRQVHNQGTVLPSPRTLTKQKHRRFPFWKIVSLLFLLPIFVQAQAQQPVPVADTQMFSPGEYLVYNVSWMNASIGQVRLKTYESYDCGNGKRNYRASALVDSYRGVPFVNIHDIDTTCMDNNFYSVGFHAAEKKDDHWRIEHSRYDFAHRRLIIESYDTGQSTASLTSDDAAAYDTLNLADTLIEDGLSILYFARANVMRQETISVPTIVYGKQGQTVFQFSNTKSDEEIDALEGKKIRTVAFEGKAQFKGIFGLTGDFKGWFSDDSAAVPIKAEMKVLVGSVKIELMKWSRKGWSPPLVE